MSFPNEDGNFHSCVSLPEGTCRYHVCNTQSLLIWRNPGHCYRFWWMVAHLFYPFSVIVVGKHPHFLLEKGLVFLVKITLKLVKVAPNFCLNRGTIFPLRIVNRCIKVLIKKPLRWVPSGRVFGAESEQGAELTVMCRYQPTGWVHGSFNDWQSDNRDFISWDSTSYMPHFYGDKMIKSRYIHKIAIDWWQLRMMNHHILGDLVANPYTFIFCHKFKDMLS